MGQSWGQGSLAPDSTASSPEHQDPPHRLISGIPGAPVFQGPLTPFQLRPDTSIPSQNGLVPGWGLGLLSEHCAPSQRMKQGGSKTHRSPGKRQGEDGQQLMGDVLLLQVVGVTQAGFV